MNAQRKAMILETLTCIRQCVSVGQPVDGFVESLRAMVLGFPCDTYGNGEAGMAPDEPALRKDYVLCPTCQNLKHKHQMPAEVR
jgi:hypothetical protein